MFYPGDFRSVYSNGVAALKNCSYDRTTYRRLRPPFCWKNRLNCVLSLCISG